METIQYRLGSNTMCHAPGIIAWAINGYKFKKDREAILNVVLAWDIPEQVAKDLLSENGSKVIRKKAIEINLM